MNIVEALNRSKHRKAILNGEIAEVGTYGYLFWRKGVLVNGKDLLKGDWQPYKDKKQMILKDITWHKTGNIVYPSNFYCWDEVLNKPGMTMTLTWEE